MDLNALVRSALIRHGIENIEENGAFHMTMCSGSKIWRVLIAASGDDIICCAQFPWRSGNASLRVLNELNLSQNVGCFMLSGGYIILRCGICSVDPMEAGELAIALLRRCGSEVCRFWDRVYSAVEVGNEF